MTDPAILALASSGLVAAAVTTAAALKGWSGWLELRRLELSSGRRHEGTGEVSELKRRVRRLEAIADGREG